MIASLFAPMQNRAQSALQAVDNRREPLGIYKIKIGIALEIAGRTLEVFEFS